jgi:hypothetical protein
MKLICPIKRRSVRLLNAIHELHRQGYQNLACFCYMSSSGFHWRLELKHFTDLFIDECGEVKQIYNSTYEQTYHSSGQDGFDYFGWSDARKASAKELAELIKKRFPRLIQSCQGENFEYVGWFVYVIGQAEQERLPLFFLEYNQPTKEKIFSTESGTHLIAPPHLTINKKNNIKWLWLDNVDISGNWHAAYQPVIDAIRTAEIPKLPKYPAHTKDTIPHAAYWEGAVYYLTTVMNYDCEIDYIRDRVYTNSRWEQFELIYNSEGQLHLLDAHMARVALSSDEQVLPEKLRIECESSLRDIKLLYREKKYFFPNPFFGGYNPMHLTSLSASPPK